MEIFRQEYRSGSPCPPPGDLADPRIELLCLLDCRWILSLLRHWGTPFTKYTYVKLSHCTLQISYNLFSQAYLDKDGGEKGLEKLLNHQEERTENTARTRVRQSSCLEHKAEGGFDSYPASLGSGNEWAPPYMLFPGCLSLVLTLVGSLRSAYKYWVLCKSIPGW